MLRKRRFWLGLAVSLFFMVLFLYRTDFRAMGDAFWGANYLFVLPAAAVYFVALFFRVGRWYVLLLPMRRIGFRNLFSVMSVGYMVNNILPLRLGDLARAYLLGEKEHLSKAAVLATVAGERVLDGVALVLFLVAGAMFVPLTPLLRDMTRITALLFLGALVLLILVSFRGAILHRAMALPFIPLSIQAKAQEVAGLFLSGLKAMKSLRGLAMACALSILMWLAEAAIFYMVSLSFSLELPFWAFIMATAAANLSISLPSSQGGIGPFEVFTLQVLLLFGSNAAVATAYAVALHATILLPVTLLGLYYLVANHLSLGRMVAGEGATAARRGVRLPLERREP
ncbi:MAG: flippase-like domain-containing protein [Chloroflexi bacterium]|nr:flippase-like domain-containing protein [Chloroflexota bacterium]